MTNIIINSMVVNLCLHPQLATHYKKFLAISQPYWEQEAINGSLMLPFIQVALLLNPRASNEQLLKLAADQPNFTSTNSAKKLGYTDAIHLKTKIELLLEINKNKDIELVDAETHLRRILQETLIAQCQSNTFISRSGSVHDPFAKTSSLIVELENTAMLSNKRGDEGLVNLFTSYNTSLGERVRLNIPPFDQLLRGGPALSSTVIISGTTNTLKSYLAQHILMSGAQAGYSTLLCSREDANPLTRARLLCSLLKISEQELEQMTDQEKQKATELHFEALNEMSENERLGDKLKNGIFMERFGIDSMTPMEIENRLIAIKENTGRSPRIIVVDYLQCATPNGGKRTDERKDSALERFVRELEDVLIKHKAIAIIVSQAKGSQVGKGTIDLSNAGAESYAAIQACNYVIYISRTQEEIDRITKSPDKNPRQMLILAKSKDTPTGICHTLTLFKNSTWHFFKTKDEQEGFISEVLSEYNVGTNPLDLKKLQLND